MAPDQAAGRLLQSRDAQLPGGETVARPATCFDHGVFHAQQLKRGNRFQLGFELRPIFAGLLGQRLVIVLAGLRQFLESDSGFVDQAWLQRFIHATGEPALAIVEHEGAIFIEPKAGNETILKLLGGEFTRLAMAVSISSARATMGLYLFLRAMDWICAKATSVPIAARMSRPISAFA